MASTVVSWA